MRAGRWLLLLLFAVAIACDTSQGPVGADMASIPSTVAPNVPPTAVPATPTTAAASSSPTASSSTAAPVRPQALPPLPVPKEPFVFDPEWPECIHPGVEPDCVDGWCRVPAGCYIFGSREGEPGRAALGERRGPITFTYEFEAMQHELTWEQWDSLGWPRQTTIRTCDELECPAKMNWLEGMMYANHLSETHQPPLEKCYEPGPLCANSPGNNMTCGEVYSKHPIHECTGYRLPTQFEWQYLARAGTPTSFYTGDVISTATRDCAPKAALEGIAWYCGNTGEEWRMRPVGLKVPNQWGFFDVVGNAKEWMNTGRRREPESYPAVDPALEAHVAESTKMTGGGSSHSWPSTLRVSGFLSGHIEGLRLVRTLGPGTVPILE